MKSVNPKRIALVRAIHEPAPFDLSYSEEETQRLRDSSLRAAQRILDKHWKPGDARHWPAPGVYSSDFRQ